MRCPQRVANKLRLWRQILRLRRLRRHRLQRSRSTLLYAPGLDLDVDRNRLANAGN